MEDEAGAARPRLLAWPKLRLCGLRGLIAAAMFPLAIGVVVLAQERFVDPPRVLLYALAATWIPLGAYAVADAIQRRMWDPEG